MSSKKFILGGDIKKSLTEGYKFNLQKLLLDAFKVTKSNFLPLLGACVLIILVFLMLTTLLIDDLNSFNDPNYIETFINSSKVQIMSYVTSIIILPPLMSGLIMMGVHHSIGLKTNIFHLFHYFKMLLNISLAALMLTLISDTIGKIFVLLFGGAGFTLSIIVLLYLKMSFCLVYPLITEKKVSPFNALKLSFKLVHKNIGQFSLLLIIFITLLMLGILTSGLGLLFIIPFSINLLGLIYRQICGVGISVTDSSDAASENGEDQDPGTSNGNFEA